MGPLMRWLRLVRRGRWLVLVIAAALALTACGGGHHTARSQLVKTVTKPSGQLAYDVKLPNGKVVEQAHSPKLAEPTGSTRRLTRSVSGVSTVEQYDSVTLSTVPRSAHYVAGYVNGSWPTYWQMRGHWPVVVGISVTRSAGADCLDMEPGNPGPDAAGPWAKWQFTQGNTRPCEYSMLSWFPQIDANLRSWGVAICSTATQTHCVLRWDANWTYSRHLDGGFMCTQWTDHSGGLNLDESTCATGFYRVAPSPVPPDPYAKYVKTVFQLAGGAKASERGQTMAWDRYRCSNPTRRLVCKSVRGKIALLRDRDVFVARHQLVRGHWVALKKPRYAYTDGTPLGPRIHGLQVRIHATQRCTPAACG